MFVRGRPKDQAPAGHVTVREAAEMYGVTEQAVRQRIKRGTLPIFTATTTTPGKELRHYIPREAVEEELKNRELQLPTEDQRGGLEAFATRLDAFAARLDAISERQERTEGKVAELVDKLARQDRIGVAQEESALRERLETEQAAREAAERERDELRMQIRRLVDPQEDPSQEVDDEPTEVFESSERIDAEPPAFDGIDGKKVKSLRDGQWWTQDDLAEKSGVNRMTIVDIERGRNTHPRRGTIHGLARAFGVPPEKLMVPAP